MGDATSWWDIAQRIGSGAAFVMGIALTFLWRAYLAELTYSRNRDTQTLTVLLNLTKIVENIESRDKETVTRNELATAGLLAAIGELRNLITEHYRSEHR